MTRGTWASVSEVKSVALDDGALFDRAVYPLNLDLDQIVINVTTFESRT